MLLLDDVAELIVGNNLVKLSMGHFNKKFDLLVICSIVVHNLSCNGSPEFATISHITNEGETNKFIRTKMRKFEIRWINIQAGQIGCREEDWRARLPSTGTHTKIGIVGVMFLANS